MWIKQFPWCPLAIAHLYILNHLVDSQKTDIVPQTPQIYKLTAEYISDTLDVEWYDGGSAYPAETNVIWEIQVLREKPVLLEIYRTTLTGDDNLLHWQWISNLPLNCTTHNVRIRARFARTKVWSKWSRIWSIPGKEFGMYPRDRVVEVGSDVTFCCVWKKTERITSLSFAGCQTSHCQTARLTRFSSTLHAKNIAVSPTSGFNAWCRAGNDFSSSIYGTVLFVGYPPDTPQKFTCGLLSSEKIKCQWEPGRPTALYGSRGTHYFLTEQLSRTNITCPHARHTRVPSECIFPILDDQTKYDFTLQAYNHLGHAKASILFETDIY
ncbi:leukemia inhibitory factor receptor [Anolis carolinensis]|uniref:leukemia inhibitory factor receptor n=1 Tax=Anolis carolinensis TaxID=28377 RepID=UPI002F2B56C5